MQRKATAQLPVDTQSTAELEDEIYVFADKIVALCVVQKALDDCDYALPMGIRSHYSLIMEEQARELRSLLVSRFD